MATKKSNRINGPKTEPGGKAATEELCRDFPDLLDGDLAEQEALLDRSDLIKTAMIVGSKGAIATVPINTMALPMPNGETRHVLTSYSPGNPEHGRLLFRAINSDDHKGDWAKANVIETEHIVLHPWSKEDEATGEVTEGTRVVLISPSGERVAMVSEGVAKALALACAFFGKPPWVPPIKFKVIEIPTAKGRRFYTLDIAS